MQQNQLEAMMTKQIGVSLQSLEWFILFGFLKSIVEDPEKVKSLFASAADCDAIEAIMVKIQKQFAPTLHKDVEKMSDFEAMLMEPPKKLILPEGMDRTIV